MSNTATHPTQVINLDEEVIEASTEEQIVVSKNNVTDLQSLKDEAFREAGIHTGEPESLKSHINIIAEEHIKRVLQDKELQLKAKEKVQKEIDDLTSALESTKKDIDNYEIHLIPLQTEKIAAKSQEINSLQEKIDQNKLDSEFEPIRYWKLLILYTLLTIYLIFFYASAINAAFFRDMGSVVNNASQDNISLLLNSIFDANGIFRLSPALIFAYLGAFVFFGLGMIPHILFEKMFRLKYLAIAGSVLLCLLIDGMIAYKIDLGIHELKILMNIQEPWTWYTSINFYLVLAFGFGGYMIWGIIYETMLLEKRKKKPQYGAKLILENLNTELEDLKNVLSKLNLELKGLQDKVSSILEKINEKKADLNKQFINKEGLMLTVEAFYNGWLRYVNLTPNKRSLDPLCRKVYEDFKNETFTKYA